MSTPPHSPQPQAVEKDPLAVAAIELLPAVAAAKQKTGRRTTRWVIILVSLALIFITASSRYDVAGGGSHHEGAGLSTLESLLQKRMPQVGDLSVASGGSSPTATTAVTMQDIPSIPSSPPVLPTPFPQPFDNSIGQNFSSQSCSNFFLNMTNTAPFRYCRPFSLLLQSSSSFVDAQEDIDLLNTIVWGTCNTSPGATECNENIAWFAQGLEEACAADIRDKNANALNALRGLQTYPLMSAAGCLANPTTNNYCYVEAVSNTNPSDLYFYQIPSGIALPTSTKPTCSACTQSLMGLYNAASSGGNATRIAALSELKATYDKAALLANKECGATYAATSEASNAAISGAEECRVRLSVGMVSVLGAVILGVLTLL